MTKVFASNPLALSVPDAVFETWLRDTGYLEILDDRTIADPSTPSSSFSLIRTRPTTAPPTSTPATKVSTFSRIFSLFRTLAAVLTLNPFAKLTPDDFSSDTPSWTLGFIGGEGSYSWPGGASQARMRVHENVRRYARNYAFLTVIFFACSLYKMPVSLLGLITTLGVWELLRYCDDVWELDKKFPALRQALALIAQIASSVILYLCNLHLALICALSVSYIVMILHASLRKLTPSKHNQDRRFLQKRVQVAAK